MSLLPTVSQRGTTIQVLPPLLPGVSSAIYSPFHCSSWAALSSSQYPVPPMARASSAAQPINFFVLFSRIFYPAMRRGPPTPSSLAVACPLSDYLVLSFCLSRDSSLFSCAANRGRICLRSWPCFVLSQFSIRCSLIARILFLGHFLALLAYFARSYPPSFFLPVFSIAAIRVLMWSRFLFAYFSGVAVAS